jgi:putative methyltransferase (TIGR04325 family)
MITETSGTPLRVRQIRLTGAALNWIGRLSPAQRLIDLFRIAPGSRALYRWALGYHRPFRTLEEAVAAVSAYAQQGHQNPNNADIHLSLNKRARPSDYAALFHLQRLLPNIHRVFDLGGNVGNLYYCYTEHLTPSEDIIWQVHDLPDNMARGRTLAQTRGADRLLFADSWSEADGADLLLISGAMHYLKEPLASMLAKLDRFPKYILINRTPITDGASFATIQDSGTFRVACMVRNRHALLQELEQVGYHLEDSWQAAELFLRIPADPDHSVPFYSGFLLRHASETGARSAAGAPQAQDPGFQRAAL